MTQFSLPQMTPCVISDVNVRSEKRGSEHIPAVDLTISMQAANDVLIEFDPQLLGMLYEAHRILNRVKDGQTVDNWLILWALRQTGDA